MGHQKKREKSEHRMVFAFFSFGEPKSALIEADFPSKYGTFSATEVSPPDLLSLYHENLKKSSPMYPKQRSLSHSIIISRFDIMNVSWKIGICRII